MVTLPASTSDPALHRSPEVLSSRRRPDDARRVDGIPLPASCTWAAARSAGVTRRQVDQDGVRLGRGLYLSRAVEPDLIARCTAWAQVLPPDCAFSGVTAAVILGAPLCEPTRLHVAVTPRRVLPQHAGLMV